MAADSASDATRPLPPVKDVVELGNDAQFSELFAKWKDLDTKGADGQSVTATDVRQLAAMNMPAATPSLMPIATATLTSGYGMRDHPVLRRRANHKGVDLAAATGTPIYATADGTVSRANYSGSYGNVVYIEHAGEMQTRYAHMSRIATADGAQVKKGDLIGYVGSTGRSTGPHLHYEVRISGRAVNPVPYMKDTHSHGELALVEGEGGRGGD
ncbi:M23 family metallopeptidase [Qipengyuania sp. JC766]|uniref:M23 family metallopeptidase n=1 Tax=Qipengyuania sp. JC766 TaxID=3232139 RepID=UPI0034583E3B